jgi:AmmeMemoRadiSam system protein A
VNKHRPLTEEEKETLLRVARTAIEEQLQNPPDQPPELDQLPARLQANGASFVTLTLNEQLHGCIGSLQARRPLAHDVHQNALAAAFRDPRFRPLQKQEVDLIVIEVSVLSAPEPLAYADAEDLVQKLRPHVDGVVLKKGLHRATFLPQVWEKLPRPEEFLAHLCYKAGLPPNAWQQPDIEINTYQVTKFTEAD